MVTESITRIAPLEPPYDAEVAEQLARMMPRGEPAIGLFRTFVKNMAMTRAMGEWGRYELGKELSIPMRDREIVIDRVCARCRCEYEWGVHVRRYADRVGLGAAQVRSLTVGSADDDCWTDEHERTLIRVVDALHEGADVPDELWVLLVDHYTDPQVLDLLLLAGWYHAISFVARAARVRPEEGHPLFADHCRMDH